MGAGVWGARTIAKMASCTCVGEALIPMRHERIRVHAWLVSIVARMTSCRAGSNCCSKVQKYVFPGECTGMYPCSRGGTMEARVPAHVILKSCGRFRFCGSETSTRVSVGVRFAQAFWMCSTVISWAYDSAWLAGSAIRN